MPKVEYNYDEDDVVEPESFIVESIPTDAVVELFATGDVHLQMNGGDDNALVWTGRALVAAANDAPQSVAEPYSVLELEQAAQVLETALATEQGGAFLAAQRLWAGTRIYRTTYESSERKAMRAASATDIPSVWREPTPAALQELIATAMLDGEPQAWSQDTAFLAVARDAAFRGEADGHVAGRRRRERASRESGR